MLNTYMYRSIKLQGFILIFLILFSILIYSMKIERVMDGWVDEGCFMAREKGKRTEALWLLQS